MPTETAASGTYKAFLADGGMGGRVGAPKVTGKAVMWKWKEITSQMAGVKRDPEGKRGASVIIANPFLQDGAATNTMDVHVEEIPPLRSPHPAHRHACEAILYIQSGRGYSIVDGVRYDWSEGDIIGLPSMVWHQHFNTDPVRPARFIAFKNNPLMKSMNMEFFEMKPWDTMK